MADHHALLRSVETGDCKNFMDWYESTHLQVLFFNLLYFHKGPLISLLLIDSPSTPLEQLGSERSHHEPFQARAVRSMDFIWKMDYRELCCLEARSQVPRKPICSSNSLDHVPCWFILHGLSDS